MTNTTKAEYLLSIGFYQACDDADKIATEVDFDDQSNTCIWTFEDGSQLKGYLNSNTLRTIKE